MSRRSLPPIALLFVTALVIVGLSSRWAGAGGSLSLNLGQAGPQYFAVLGLGSPTKVSITGPSSVQGGTGNVGVAAGGNFSMSNGSVSGAVYLNTAGSANVSGPSTIAGGVVQNSATDARLAHAVTDAINASAYYAGLPATISPPTSLILNGGHATITGGAGVNVLQLSSVVMNGAALLTLNAPAGSIFIVNVTKDFQLNGSSDIVLAGGISPFCVLYNIIGPGNQVAFSGGLDSTGTPKSSVQGILLAPQRNIGLDPGQVTPEVIGGGQQITITSGGQVIDNFCPPPTITCPANIVTSTDPNKCSAVVAFMVNASSTCSAVTVTSSPPSGTAFPVGTTTVTSTATDASGQTSSCSFTVTVNDTQKPTLNGVPPNATVQCDAVPPAGSPTAADNCPNVKLSFSQTTAPGTCANRYTITRTWTATDASGNATSGSQTITVQDTKAPVLSGVPADTTVECGAVPAAASPTAKDNCDPNPGITFAEVKTGGTCANSYVLTRTWTATDACANSSSASQKITVQDTTAPVLSGVPADTSVQCDAVPPAAATVTAKDNCDPNPGITFAEVKTGGACANSYTLTRTWTATDACANSSSASQKITVQDTKAPTLQGVPADATAQCDAVPSPASVTASDNCDLNPKVTFSETNSPGTCANSYVLTRMWTATDVCGNSSSASQKITVQDTTAPTLNGVPADTSVECDAVPAPASPTAKDNCDPNPGITFGEVKTPGTCANSYLLTRTWTATDACGNFSSASQKITVRDTTAPVLSGVPADTSVQCDAVPAAATTVTAKDNCDPGPKVTFGEVKTPGTCANSYLLTRTWTAIDACGNSSSQSQKITVQDTTPPTLSGQGADTTIECPSKPVFTPPTATDNCDPNPQVKLVSDITTAGACPGTSSETRTWQAVDACGNMSTTVSQTITVKDTTPPSITCPTNVSTCAPSGQTGATADPGKATATDTCDPNPVVVGTRSDTKALTDPYPLGITTITWTATDCSGNMATCNQTVTVTTCAMIRGQVTCTESGGGIAGATVLLIKNGQAVQMTNTDAKGNYQFPDVQDGSYSVQGSATNFATNTSAPFAFVRMGPNDAIENVALTPLPIQDVQVPHLQGRVFFSTTFSGMEVPGIVHGPTTAVDVDADASVLGDLTNGGFADPTFDTSHRYYGYIPGFPELGLYDATHPVWLIMEKPLQSGDIWNSSSDSFRNMVYARDGLFSPAGDNSTYVIRLLFSHPFLGLDVPRGTAQQYTITNLDTSTTPDIVPGSVGWLRYPTVQWTSPAGAAPPSGDLTDIPPGWMAQTRFQFQQTAGQTFVIFADGSYADACLGLKTFHIHPAEGPSPGDEPATRALAAPEEVEFPPSPR